MLKHTSIQLNIPTPCHEDWEKMTPCEQGRFCSSCRKTVIDFTSWSDKALYEFFSKNTAPVCGNFFSSQLRRDINIPYQPKSRIYRLAIACGLTLMFAQVPDVHAMVRQPIEMLSSVSDNKNTDDTSKNGSGVIKGTASDENGEPVIGALVEVFRDSIKKGAAVTDIDGNYEIKPLQPGIYELKSRYADYKRIRITEINVALDRPTVIPINFKLHEEVQLRGYIAPLISDPGIRDQKSKFKK